MTGRLNLHLDKYLMSDPVDRAAVASIRTIPAPDDHTASRKIREVMIPSGGARPVGIELDAGRYLIEAALPSGEVVADEVEVFENAEAGLGLRSEESPHEWLSWQQFLGLIEPKGIYDLNGDEAGLFSTTATLVHDPIAQLRGDPDSGEAWVFLSGLSTSSGDIANSVSQGSPTRVDPFQSDRQSLLYQVTRTGSWNSWPLPTQYAGDAPYTPRQYLVVEAGDVTQLVCLPTPWLDVRTQQEIPVQVLVHRGDSSESASISVTTRDALYGPALGYMAHGALPTAQRMFNPGDLGDEMTPVWQELLFDKLANPLAAAAGGYMLLGTECDLQPKRWHQWIENLMNLFPWLPDGAIQYAWLRLRHRQEPSDFDLARKALLTAYSRGLPLYSLGLRWLIDGLTLFAAQDSAAQQMLEHVHWLASRVDSREPFTIVRLPPR